MARKNKVQAAINMRSASQRVLTCTVQHEVISSYVGGGRKE